MTKMGILRLAFCILLLLKVSVNLGESYPFQGCGHYILAAHFQNMVLPWDCSQFKQQVTTFCHTFLLGVLSTSTKQTVLYSSKRNSTTCILDTENTFNSYTSCTEMQAILRWQTLLSVKHYYHYHSLQLQYQHLFVCFFFFNSYCDQCYFLQKYSHKNAQFTSSFFKGKYKQWQLRQKTCFPVSLVTLQEDWMELS